MTIHLVKLCVGAEAVDDLIRWQDSRRALSPDGSFAHVTRMWPRQQDALLDGGSLYWVFKGLILARQNVLRLDEVLGDDGITRCGIVLDHDVVLTEPRPRRPFQGWRYLQPEDAPPDLSHVPHADTTLPPELAAALKDIGVVPS